MKSNLKNSPLCSLHTMLRHHVLSVEAKPNTLTEDFEKGLSSSANNQWKGRQGRGHAAVAQWPKCLVFDPIIIMSIFKLAVRLPDEQSF